MARTVARALIADFPSLPARERNAVRWLVLDPRAREIHADWTAAVADLTGMLRMDLGRHPDDPKTVALVDELRGASAVFRDIWAGGRVSRSLIAESKVIRHPVAGPVRLHVEAVRITEDPDQTLHVMIPDRSSREALARLH
jgi:MmyB-like transcription regulator ligand binding domain